MGVNAVREQLLSTLSGWNIYPYEKATINVPAAIVGFPRITRDTYGKRKYETTVALWVSSADEESAQRTLGDAIDVVQAAIESSGLKNAQVVSADGLFTMNSGPGKFLGVNLEVEFSS